MKQIPEFQIIKTALEELKTGISPAEMHGLICGIICGDNQSDIKQQWQTLILNDKKANSPLEQLFAYSDEHISQGQFDFQLLLPPESSDIHDRTLALAQWSQSFISGLGIAGMTIHKSADPELEETLNDLVEISKAYSKYHNHNEENETSYIELIEYVRMAVLFIFTEVRLTKTDKKENVINRYQ